MAIGDNLKAALSNLVSQNAIGIEIQNTDDVNGLIELIIKANKNLEQSTENGDWEMVGKDMERLQDLIKQLDKVYSEEQSKKQSESKNTKQDDETGENKDSNENKQQEIINDENESAREKVTENQDRNL